MDPNLVHSAGEGSAQHNTGLSVETESFELCAALFALRRHLAHSDLVAHHLHGLRALSLASEKNTDEYKKRFFQLSHNT